MLHAIYVSYLVCQCTRSINNFRGALSNLFHFARQRNYLERENRVMEDVPEAIEPQRKITIYTPEQLRSILSACPSNFLPFILLAAFAGVRQSELARLTWENIGDDEIEVPPGAYRVKSTRLIPIHPTLKEWLKLVRKQGGPVVVHKNVSNKLRAVITDAGQTPLHNALRHSYGSYSLALSRNPDIRPHRPYLIAVGLSHRLVTSA